MIEFKEVERDSRDPYIQHICRRRVLMVDEENGRMSIRISTWFPTRVSMAWPILCLDLHALSQPDELSICFLIRKLTSSFGVGLHFQTVSWRFSISWTNRGLAGVWMKHFVGFHILFTDWNCGS